MDSGSESGYVLEGTNDRSQRRSDLIRGMNMKRREGSLHYTEIAVLMLLGYPACTFLGLFSVGIIDFPTPGLYALRLLPLPSSTPEDWFNGFLTRLAVVGFVNVVCGWTMIYGLLAVLSRLRRSKGTKANGEPGLSNHVSR